MGSSSCAHERSHIVDSWFHGDAYSTADSHRIFCDVCRIRRWVDIEVALALSQADVGIIPAAAADAIAAGARADELDMEEIAAGIRRTNHSLVAVLSALQKASGTWGEYVHFGATTQDIQDTAQVLEMRDVLDRVDETLPAILGTLAELSLHERDTLMIGRTHAQPALPSTFGLKVASWIDELLRHTERLTALRERALVVELAGGVGTMASFGPRAGALLEAFAARLGLRPPAMGWHVARDRVAEFLTVAAMLTATLARVADEIRTLGRPEMGEVAEAWDFGRVGSSTMPHKRNPDASSQVVVLAGLTRVQVLAGLEGMIQEHERDARGLRLEWATVAECSHYMLAALAITDRVVAGLAVDGTRMGEEARSPGAESICSEALMMALASRIGKQSAHAVVYDVSQRAHGEGTSLRRALLARTDLAGCLNPGELDEILDPHRHLGEAGAMVDTVVGQVRHRFGVSAGSRSRR